MARVLPRARARGGAGRGGGDSRPSGAAANELQRPVQPPPLPPHALAGGEPAAATEAGPARSAEGLEAALGRRWLFWLGGAALALGGAFFVKVVIEEDLIGPAGRAIAGTLLASSCSTAAARCASGPIGSA